jgi:hypothetical protein
MEGESDLNDFLHLSNDHWQIEQFNKQVQPL